MSDDDVPALLNRGDSSSEYDDSSDEDSSYSSGSNAEDSIPGLAPNTRRGNTSNMNGSNNSYMHPPIKQAQFQPNDAGSEGDSEDSDSDGPPPLQNRGNDDSSSDDSDSSSSIPNLISRNGEESSDDSDSSEDDKRPKRRNGFNASDSSDEEYDGMPVLQERENSSSDESDSEDEMFARRGQSTRRKVQPAPKPPPPIRKQIPKPKINPHEEFHKMVTNMMCEKGFKGNADIYINDLERSLELQDKKKFKEEKKSCPEGTFKRYIKIPNGREKLLAKMVKDISLQIQLERKNAEERKRIEKEKAERLAMIKIASCYRRSRAQARYAKLRHGIILMQSVSRGVLARKLHITREVLYLEEFRRDEEN